MKENKNLPQISLFLNKLSTPFLCNNQKLKLNRLWIELEKEAKGGGQKEHQVFATFQQEGQQEEYIYTLVDFTADYVVFQPFIQAGAAIDPPFLNIGYLVRNDIEFVEAMHEFKQKQ